VVPVPDGPSIPSGPTYTELIPRPDPSKLTDAAIGRATEQFRRELDELRTLLAERIETLNTALSREVVAARDTLELRAELRETAAEALKTLLEARMNSMDAATSNQFDQVTAASVEHALARDKAVAGLQSLIETRIAGLQSLIETRIAAMDTATELLASDVRQVPTVLQFNISSLRELMESKLAGMEEAVTLQNRQWEKLPAEIHTEIQNLRQLHEEKFASIAQQFSERDIRTSEAAKAAKDALDAALQAAKELVNAQGEASSAAAVKSETSFTKQIDQIGTIISTLEKALDARITELKERIDRGEGNTSGQAAAAGTTQYDRTFEQTAQLADAARQRAVVASVIAGVSVLVALVSVVLLVVLHK
jgi:hypothetical protein